MAMTIQLVVDMSGETPGLPGISRSFAYAKAGTVCTLSLHDDSGVDSYFWEILDKPTGSTTTLSDDEAAAPTFTPTAAKSGTYLFQCTVNGGQAYARIWLSILTQNRSLRKPAVGETTQGGSAGWQTAISDLMDAVDGISGGAGTVSAIKLFANSPYETIDGEAITLWDTVGGACEQILPDATLPENEDRRLTVMDWGNHCSSNKLKLSAHSGGGQTVNGAAYIEVATNGGGSELLCKGGHWRSMQATV